MKWKKRELDMKEYNRICANINLDAIAYNMEQMKRHIGEETQLMAVIKADAYGHGAAFVARMLEDVSYVWGYAVASLDEALVLKENGIQKPILVLGCVFPDQYEEMARQEIRAAVYTKEMAREMSETAVRLHKKAYLHVKLDTGMGRIGFAAGTDAKRLETVQEVAKLNELPGALLEGIFTHFARADEAEHSYTDEQYERFRLVTQEVARMGVSIPLVHCDNSAGIMEYPQYGHQLARAGISMYGIYPSDEVSRDVISLKPALELVSHVTFVKTVEAGTPISYGGTFVAPKRMRVATIPVGYGDGYPRSLSNKGEVLIHGKRARILGRVCMDQFMVDVTDIPETAFMDRVVLLGRDGDECILAEELGEQSGRFHYEFVCCLGRRVPRNYIKNGNVVCQSEAFYTERQI